MQLFLGPGFDSVYQYGKSALGFATLLNVESTVVA